MAVFKDKAKVEQLHLKLEIIVNLCKNWVATHNLLVQNNDFIDYEVKLFNFYLILTVKMTSVNKIR